MGWSFEGGRTVHDALCLPRPVKLFIVPRCAFAPSSSTSRLLRVSHSSSLVYIFLAILVILIYRCRLFAPSAHSQSIIIAVRLHSHCVFLLHDDVKLLKAPLTSVQSNGGDREMYKCMHNHWHLWQP